MANLKASKKSIRQIGKRTERNKSVLSKLKTLKKNAMNSIQSNDTSAAKTSIRTYLSALDKASKRNIVHTNKANRHKSALAAQLFAE